jgi:hypothetical protein
VLALLDRWLTAGACPERTRARRGRRGARPAHHRDAAALPVVGDVARAVRFRYFEQPVVLEARSQVFAEAERLLAELTDSPGRPTRRLRERIEALVASPEPLIRCSPSASAAAAPRPSRSSRS